MKLKFTMINDLDTQQKMKLDVDDELKSVLSNLENKDIDIEVENKFSGTPEKWKGNLKLVDKGGDKFLYIYITDQT